MPKGTKEQVQEQRNRRTQRTREFISKSKRNKKCVLCGYDEHLEILEFHHIDTKHKKFNIREMARRNRNYKEIQKEIDKCTLLCPNCHRWYHFKEKRGL